MAESENHQVNNLENNSSIVASKDLENSEMLFKNNDTNSKDQQNKSNKKRVNKQKNNNYVRNNKNTNEFNNQRYFDQSNDFNNQNYNSYERFGHSNHSRNQRSANFASNFNNNNYQTNYPFDYNNQFYDYHSNFTTNTNKNKGNGSLNQQSSNFGQIQTNTPRQSFFNNKYNNNNNTNSNRNGNNNNNNYFYEENNETEQAAGYGNYKFQSNSNSNKLNQSKKKTSGVDAQLISNEFVSSKTGNQQQQRNQRGPKNSSSKSKNLNRKNENDLADRGANSDKNLSPCSAFSTTNEKKQTSNNGTKSNKTIEKQQHQSNRTNKSASSNLTRSEILIDQLKKNKCECMVCCQNIRSDKAVWSCSVCFHIFHLYCIKKWASSAAAKIEENLDKWRCPGCQNICEQIPSKYICFCGKKINPELNKEEENKPFHLRQQVPHSCNDVCGKSLSLSFRLGQQDQDLLEQQQLNPSLECKHKCVQLCHPGPCAPCDALVTRTCNCTKAKFQVKCSSLKTPQCDRKCENLLNCKLHSCNKICHSGKCSSCDVDIEQTCYSHNAMRQIKCGSLGSFDSKNNTTFRYRCELKCNKMLSCGNHKCEQQCHDGACETCPLMPSKLNYCPCGQTLIRDLLIKNKLIRTSCTDPIPTCEKKCNKILHNMNIDDKDLHMCQSTCHTNECPPCQVIVDLKCRCGKESESVECFKKSEIKYCNRRCQKKKSCGRHQCNELCCNDKDHICVLICNRVLDCGKHKCEQLCHRGLCQRCLVASFEERVCECGSTVQYPPIRCGTKPLECSKLCSRSHSCDHPVTHNCHHEEKCPPCTYLTSRMCMGNHELRHNIPCYLKDVGCGKLCDKKLLNCAHKCIRICHKDECLEENSVCIQPCQKERPNCIHQCNEPCHSDKPCSDTICQALILVKCKCGLKSKQLKCMQRMYEPTSQIVFENLASELKEMLSCKSIDISTFKNTQILKKKHEIPCDDECLLVERNRNIAQALQIDANARPKAIYSDFLKNFAREEPAFVFDLEKKFDLFVKEMKASKQTKKTLNLPIMKSFERKIIHELASYYGFETMSHDPEPFRNVCLYATKDKCYLPVPTLMQSIEVKTKQSTMSRLSSLKQLNQNASNPIQSNLRVLQYQEPDLIPISSQFSALSEENQDEDQTQKLKQTSNANEKIIDYFDVTE